MANTTKTAARLVADLMRELDLTREQALGLVGNLAHESDGFNSLEEKGPGSGYGYAQWTGPRRTAFEKYATSQGLSPSSYEANLGFIVKEMKGTERSALARIKKADTADKAATVAMNAYFRPGTPHLQSRQNWASQFATHPVPPANIPEVASRLDTTPQVPASVQAINTMVPSRPSLPAPSPLAFQPHSQGGLSGAGVRPALPSGFGPAIPGSPFVDSKSLQTGANEFAPPNADSAIYDDRRGAMYPMDGWIAGNTYQGPVRPAGGFGSLLGKPFPMVPSVPIPKAGPARGGVAESIATAQPQPGFAGRPTSTNIEDRRGETFGGEKTLDLLMRGWGNARQWVSDSLAPPPVKLEGVVGEPRVMPTYLGPDYAKSTAPDVSTPEHGLSAYVTGRPSAERETVLIDGRLVERDVHPQPKVQPRSGRLSDEFTPRAPPPPLPRTDPRTLLAADPIWAARGMPGSGVQSTPMPSTFTARPSFPASNTVAQAPQDTRPIAPSWLGDLMRQGAAANDARGTPSNGSLINWPAIQHDLNPILAMPVPDYPKIPDVTRNVRVNPSGTASAWMPAPASIPAFPFPVKGSSASGVSGGVAARGSLSLGMPMPKFRNVPYQVHNPNYRAPVPAAPIPAPPINRSATAQQPGFGGLMGLFAQLLGGGQGGGGSPLFGGLFGGPQRPGVAPLAATFSPIPGSSLFGGLFGGAAAPRNAAGQPIASGGTVIGNAVYGNGGRDYGADQGQVTAGLKPGERTYNPDTNSWGLKR